MNTKETNQVISDKISLFDEILENINTKDIEITIDKISKRINLDGVIEEDESNEKEQEQEKDQEQEKNKDMTLPSKDSLNNIEIKRSRFPYYEGSFKNDLEKFLNNPQNKDLNQLYHIILKEIQKVYLGYIHVENKLYNKINQYIKFSDSKNNTPMEIISKMKDISKTLEETIKFIEIYLFQNFKILEKIFKKIDKKLSDRFDVESVSLFFLLHIFDLPNNELSYIMMFKIIDEESCVLNYLIEVLDNQIKNIQPKDNNSNNNGYKSDDNEAYLMDEKSGLTTESYNIMLNIRNTYISKIKESINYIDSYSCYRAKYYNKYIYTKGNYEVDTNLFLNKIIEDNDDNNNEEFLPINSLMDEEVVINKFINKSLVKKFLNNFKSQLSPIFKTDEKLIILHSIQYNIVSVFVIFWYRKFEYSFLDVGIFYIGRISSKIFFNSLLKKRKKIKSLLITSNVILILSLIIHLFGIGESYYKFIYFTSRFLIGLSFTKNIETKFILNYVPKLLVRKEIKKYYSINYLSLFLGFSLVSSFNYLFDFIETKKDDIKTELEDKNLDINNVGELIVMIISFLILIANVVFYKELRIHDIMKINDNKKSFASDFSKKASNNITTEPEITPSKKGVEDKKDATSIFSYGKAKIISFREKNKAKLLEESLKLDVSNKNYEGTNQIFNILQKLIIDEIESRKSYTNKATQGFILLFTFLYIISSIIIFYNPLYNIINLEKNNDKDTLNEHDSKKKIWIFGIPYLLSFLIYRFKLLKFSKDIFVWNIIILIFIIFEIVLNALFIVFDISFFKNSPIFFDNYYFYLFLFLSLLFLLLIEMSCLKVMIREIPIEKKISSINIDNFLDIYECIVKSATFIVFYFIIYFSFINQTIYIKYSIEIFFALSIIIFILFNLKRKQVALTKIINKITYESF